jgi:FMN reductase (NADPH)/FMN reductase [NAD(P)H]
MRGPTGGNMMLYSIIQIEDQALKDRLADTCDDQQFIAQAPWVLVFVADFQRWMDLFAHERVWDLPDLAHRRAPGMGDMLLACSDALIAAQNAAIAAESLGIGSCYIGDILENGETHAELLDLPEYALPIGMLCLGRPAAPRPPTPHTTTNVVHTDRYHRLSSEELTALSAELAAVHAPHGLKPGVASYAHDVYVRKFIPEFMTEMNRSVEWWLKRWETPTK